MKRAFLSIVVPALLVTLGFAQTPAVSSNTDPTSIKGCLGGSEGNYTFVEDNTGHNFKITTSGVDLKPHVGHDVSLIGHKANATATPGPADNSFAVTELNMISEHCAVAAAVPAASVIAPVDNAIPPTVAAAAPAATVPPPAETVSVPAADAATPAGTVTTVPDVAVTPPAAAVAATASVPASAEAASAPVADASTPAATVSAPPEIADTAPAVAGRTQPRAERRRPSATSRAAARQVAEAPPAESASTLVAEAATPAAPVSTPAEPAGTPSVAATTPAVSAKSWSSWLWIPIVVLVLVMGALAPLINRWKKRRLLEQTGAQNLSFTHDASSDPNNRDKPVVRKVA